MENNFIQSGTIFTGYDNLEGMSRLPDECFDLVATDPPYNSGATWDSQTNTISEGTRFDDIWEWGPHVDLWLERLKQTRSEISDYVTFIKNHHSESMATYICFMSLRTIEMHRLLKRTGNLFMQCDPSANGYIRIMLDMIFGKSNFRNEIIWHYKGTGNAKKMFPSKHDVIFFYAKSSKNYFNPIMVQSATKSGWTGKNEKKCDSVWSDINTVFQSSERKSSSGYATEKPIALYERIVKAGCPFGGWVLDPFAGSGTTLISATLAGSKCIGFDQNLINESRKIHIEERLGSLIGEFKVLPALPPHVRDAPTDGLFRFQPTTNPEKMSYKHRKAELKEILGERDGWICVTCDDTVGGDKKRLQIDRQIPPILGGDYTISNTNLKCVECNANKRDYVVTIETQRKANEMFGMLKSGCGSFFYKTPDHKSIREYLKNNQSAH